MVRLTGALLLLLVLACSAPTGAQAAPWETYLAVKAGGFFPNGQGGGAGSTEGGFSNFSQGFNGEVAVGIRPESYAAVELGASYYRTDANVAQVSGTTDKFDASAIPVTLTVKGILPYGRLECFAGAGVGYWSARLQYDQYTTATGGLIQQRNINGGAPGYLAVVGADYRITGKLDVGAEGKWFSAKPEFDLKDTMGTKVKWEFGGTVVNLTLKYRF